MAKILVVEDDQICLDAAREKLESVGHQVVLEASDLEAALAAVEQLESLGVQVVVLDANLHRHAFDGEDGRKIAEAIRGKGLKIGIIIWSSLLSYAWWNGKVVFKGMPDEKDLNALAEAVDRLLR